MTIEDLVVCIKIKEDNRVTLNELKIELSNKVNIVERGQSLRRYKGNKKTKSQGQG